MRWLITIVVLLAPASALALPMYAQRSGRTCGNCHISPTYQDPKGWDNPELAKRKCNMSCSVCHVNPIGGGLRNTSGFYYGRSTLSMIGFEERSYSDYDRELIGPQHMSDQPKIPSSYKDVDPDAEGEYAFWDGRYGNLDADPMFRIGTDLRGAYWSGSDTFFPMQLDLHGAVHPIEHLTAMATVAGRGRASGVEQAIQQDTAPVFLRNAFLMLHELPYMAYARAGIFMPNFGTNIDDHTSYVREYFEMDISDPDDTVIGASVGLAPNYPFANASLFTHLDGGIGGALDLGWRDLGWSVTAHGMFKRRDGDKRGDMDAAGIGFGFNPFYYSNDIPLTYMAELSFGRREDLRFVALYQELWLTVFNGVSVRLKHDLGDRDLRASSELEQRFSLALDVSPVPGVTLIAQGRLLNAADTDWDTFVQLHLWY